MTKLDSLKDAFNAFKEGKNVDIILIARDGSQMMSGIYTSSEKVCAQSAYEALMADERLYKIMQAAVGKALTDKVAPVAAKAIEKTLTN